MKALAVVLALVACGKDKDHAGDGDTADDGYRLAPKARLDGSMVVVDITCPNEYGDWEINGTHAMCEKGKPSTIALPAAMLGAGHKELEAKLYYKRHHLSAKVAIDIPDTATGPFLTVDRCLDDNDYKGNASIDLTVDGKAKVFCRTFGGARAKLAFKATPGGKLSIGDAPPADIAANGELTQTIELAPGILALKVDDAIGRDAGPTLELPYKLDAGGKTITGKLAFAFHSFDWGPVLARFFRDVAGGRIDRPAFTPPAPGARKNAVYIHDDRELQVVDHRGTVKDLAIVAIAADGEPKEAGTCEFESKGQKISAKRLNIEVTVTATALADGAQVATKAFPAPPDCPMFAMFDPAKPETKVKARSEDVMKWVETLAK